MFCDLVVSVGPPCARATFFAMEADVVNENGIWWFENNLNSRHDAEARPFTIQARVFIKCPIPLYDLFGVFVTVFAIRTRNIIVPRNLQIFLSKT